MNSPTVADLSMGLLGATDAVAAADVAVGAATGVAAAAAAGDVGVVAVGLACFSCRENLSAAGLALPLPLLILLFRLLRP